MDQLVEAFTLERIGKSGARFDIQKAQWFNQQYLRNKPDDELAGFLMDALQKENIKSSPEQIGKIVRVMKERVTFPKDFWEQGRLFFQAPLTFDEQIVSKKWNADAVKVLTAYRDEMRSLTGLTAEMAKNTLDKVTAMLGIKTGQILQVLRMTITGGASGPDLMMTLEILGSEEVEKRLTYALETLHSKVI